MGGTDFRTYGAGEQSGDAYRNATESARNEYGSDGYNGTISTTNGYVKHPSPPMPLGAAQRLADIEQSYDGEPTLQIEKWGRCGAIAVAPDDAWTTRTRKISFTVLRPEQSGGLYLASPEVLKVVDEKSGLKSGEVIQSIRDLGSTTTRKLKARRTEGPTSKSFYLSDERGNIVPHRNEGWPKMADARKVAEARAMDDGRDYGVVAVTTRESGEPLTKVEVEKEQTRFNVELTIARPKGARAVPTGWLFYGVAAC